MTPYRNRVIKINNDTQWKHTHATCTLWCAKTKHVWLCISTCVGMAIYYLFFLNKRLAKYKIKVALNAVIKLTTQSWCEFVDCCRASKVALIWWIWILELAYPKTSCWRHHKHMYIFVNTRALLRSLIKNNHKLSTCVVLSLARTKWFYCNVVS